MQFILWQIIFEEKQKYIALLKRNPIAELSREIFQSDQVFQGVGSWKENTMNKDNQNVVDGKGMEEDLKEMDKKKLKEEETGSLKMQRKPPKELMKGGIRDRPLFSWIRILGWFFPLSSSNWFSSFTLSYSVVAAIWWVLIVGFLAGCFSLMCVSISMICLCSKWNSPRYAILYGSDEGSKAPYFVRNPNKYPDLLPQPGIKIDCVSATLNYLIIPK